MSYLEKNEKVKVIDNLKGSPCSVGGYLAHKGCCTKAANCIKEVHPDDKYACQACWMQMLNQEDKKNVY